MGGTCGTYGGTGTNIHKVLVRKSKRKKSLGRLSHRCECSIQLYLKEVQWACMDWIHLSVGFCEESNEPSGSHKIQLTSLPPEEELCSVELVER
jgi:hypothetical protein